MIIAVLTFKMMIKNKFKIYLINIKIIVKYKLINGHKAIKRNKYKFIITKYFKNKI